MTKNKKSKIKKEKLERLEKAAKRAILYFLRSNPKQSYNYKQIAAGGNLRGKISHNKLNEILDQLANKGTIIHHGRGQFQAKVVQTVLDGSIEVNKEGYGFFIADDEGVEDVFIPANSLGRAFHGDRVRIKVRPGRGFKGKAEGEVLEVLESARNVFIGTIESQSGKVFFVPDEARITQQFGLHPGDMGEAKPGDKVLLEIAGWGHFGPEGRVIKVVGRSGEHNTEMHAILFQFGFETAFPEAVETEVAKIPGTLSKQDLSSRRDFRSTTTFTIDPHDAKDFDDALSFKRLPNGRYEIGVHIADVSHYVKPGTVLDDEAYHRATSVYLVDRTVPMLPERLSNDLCSLRPHLDRPTFSAVFEVDEEGTIHKEWFGKGVIHSDRRFSYEEAQEILEKGEGEFADELTILNRIAKLYQAERFRKGSINFEEDEVKFELDAEGKPIRVFRKVRKDAHKMIEDWMLTANRRVCAYVARLRKEPTLPFVYRIHDRPDEEKLVKLRQFVALLGYELDLEDPRRISEELNKLMLASEGQPEHSMVQQIAVRSMAKAIYSTTNIGHYGLGFDFYTHFTSPIRRYPDLMVHRLLGQYLDNNYAVNPADLETRCRHSTNRERRAVEAERASVKYKQVEFLEDKAGQEFEGIVTGVTNWGLYVELIENKCEGMIGLHNLEGDYYEVDPDNFCVRGRNSGEVIRLGDRLLVEVKETSLRNRTIDFALVDHLESAVDPVLIPGPKDQKPSRQQKGRNRKRPNSYSRNKSGKKNKSSRRK